MHKITSFITALKRSWGQGNMFTGVCLSTGGVLSEHVLQAVSQHALQQVSRGVCYPNMHCRWYPSMPCSSSPGGSPGPHLWRYGPGGCLVLGGPGPSGVLLVKGGCQVLGGCLLRGVPAPERGCLVETPWRLLLRAVRILLECFLVHIVFMSQKVMNLNWK